ncbi:MAG: phosphoribosylformylglycinamidine synthase subunit PurL [Candidatus Margulisbacteria bacterium]|nr:phosphoribosylformylglycinamidine synthase subunit PurL [Candidatus Margulisiibacteriota bacterium]
MVEAKVYRELGLNDQEYQRIEQLLRREPSPTELAMFSVEWSEHCGYPRSRNWLKLFPKKGKYQTLVGEDAGGFIVDDLAVIFKMESHNHPSQVEPKQGAATGVGGIVRDIFTAGARPIACLDSLRFGDLKDPFNRYIFNGVVDGISSYGNCIGVPTVGGEIYFNDAYAGNCLVNAMCVGVCHKDKVAKAQAKGVGNTIIYAGAKTGRDGIGGCSVLASAEFCEADAKRPTVQVGDPFSEKCLIEATLEALKVGSVLGVKDMGAAGLTCSSSEMAHAGGVGVEIDLDKVPLREADMQPYEIMMSESQERMLLCVEAGKEQPIIDIYIKWGLEAVAIGKVIEEQKVHITHHGKVVCDVPGKDLAAAPLYEMKWEEPKRKGRDMSRPYKKPANLSKVLLKMLSSPNIASKRWVWEQYDHMVQVNTLVYPGGDAAVLRIKGKKFGLAVTSDCNGRYCYLNPHRGAQIAVAEAARNLVVTGAEPAAVTDCLNFGNPEKPDRFYYFKSCVEGIVDACEALELPVISGNVSFYNENPKGAIFPTPTIGMVGVIKDIEKRCTIGFKEKGNLIILLGKNKEELGGSEYLKVIHGLEEGDAPDISLELERKVQQTCLTAIEVGIVRSAHDVSDGGLAVALAECCFPGKMGAVINLSDNIRDDALLFGETQSRIILTVSAEKVLAFADIAMLNQVPFEIIGKVGGQKIVVHKGKKKLVDIAVRDAIKVYEETIPSLMGG